MTSLTSGSSFLFVLLCVVEGGKGVIVIGFEDLVTALEGPGGVGELE